MLSIVTIPVPSLENKVKAVLDNHKALSDKLEDLDKLYLKPDINAYWEVIKKYNLAELVYNSEDNERLIKCVDAAVQAAIFCESDAAILHFDGDESIAFDNMVHNYDYPKLLAAIDLAIAEITALPDAVKTVVNKEVPEKEDSPDPEDWSTVPKGDSEDTFPRPLMASLKKLVGWKR